MYRYVYDLSLGFITILVVIFFLCWSCLKQNLRTKKWKQMNFILLSFILLFFIYVSLLERHIDSVDIAQWPKPFWSYKLAFFEGSIDYFQEIYLNVLSFFFIGLFFQESLYNRKTKKLFVLIFCILLSMMVEWTQFTFSLGLAEIDDIISNVLGCMMSIFINDFGYKIYLSMEKEICLWRKK